MPPLVRSAFVLLAGVIVALVVVTLMDMVAGSMYTLPAGINRGDPESLREANIPTKVFVVLLTGWVLSAAAGSYITARLSTHNRVVHGLIVTLFVLVATVGNLAAIPHPIWMLPGAVILIPLGGWLAARLAVHSRGALVAS